MSSSKRFRVANLPPILAFNMLAMSGSFRFSMSNRIRGHFCDVSSST